MREVKKKKEPTRHYNTNPNPLAYDPACGGAPAHTRRYATRDRREVTCENCKNSLAWKGRVGRHA